MNLCRRGAEDAEDQYGIKNSIDLLCVLCASAANPFIVRLRFDSRFLLSQNSIVEVKNETR